jgi:hypothetical protein
VFCKDYFVRCFVKILENFSHFVQIYVISGTINRISFRQEFYNHSGSKTDKMSKNISPEEPNFIQIEDGELNNIVSPLPPRKKVHFRNNLQDIIRIYYQSTGENVNFNIYKYALNKAATKLISMGYNSSDNWKSFIAIHDGTNSVLLTVSDMDTLCEILPKNPGDKLQLTNSILEKAPAYFKWTCCFNNKSIFLAENTLQNLINMAPFVKYLKRSLETDDFIDRLVNLVCVLRDTYGYTNYEAIRTSFKDSQLNHFTGYVNILIQLPNFITYILDSIKNM